MAKNVYNVRKRRWSKWSRAQQAMFNRMYRVLPVVCKAEPMALGVPWNSAHMRQMYATVAGLAAESANDMELRHAPRKM